MHMGSGPDVFPGWLRYVWASAYGKIIGMIDVNLLRPQV
jgi:hypothetical protein